MTGQAAAGYKSSCREDCVKLPQESSQVAVQGGASYRKD